MLAVICFASLAEAGSGGMKSFGPKAKPLTADSPRLKRDVERQALKESLVVPDGATREELEKLQQKVRLRVADGYVRHMGAPAPAYFPVDKDAYAPLTFQGPGFVQTAHRFLKTNQELICSKSNRVAFQTNKRRLKEGRGYVRMQQVYDGLPVFGGSVIVQTHGEEGVTALFSDVLRDLTRLENGRVSTVPTVTPDYARNAAIRAVSNAQFQPADLVASKPVLTIYAPGVIGMTGELQLVWDTTVTVRDAEISLFQERVLVNAQDGTIALRFNEVRTSLYRSVYDNENRDWPPPGALHSYHWFNDDNGPTYPRGKCRRWEEEFYCLGHQVGGQTHRNWPDAASYNISVYQPVPWCNIAYDYLADIYMFYKSQVQRDSYGPAEDPYGEGPGPIQDHGMHEVEHGSFPDPDLLGFGIASGYELMLTTRINLDNAFSTVYGGDPYLVIGTRYQACDDVMGHEYTHSVNSFEANFVYVTQSGALDEAFADMWGEWVDLTNTPYGTTETPNQRAVRWVMGEDTDCPYSGAGEPAGYARPDSTNPDPFQIARSVAIRDLRNPPYYGNPDKMTSPYFWTQLGDGGGVHANAGVVDKLAYLLSDGDTFNNQVVEGMGITDRATTYTFYTYPIPPNGTHTAPQLFYETQCNLLNPASDFEDLYYALLQACDNLNMTEAEKVNVDKACAAVEIRPARISEAYNIVYKDLRNPALKPIIDDTMNEIIISDPQAYGTLKITKKKGYPKNRIYDTPHGATIHAIKSAGTLLSFYTETDVDDIEVDVALQSATAKGCYIKRIRSGEVGTVRETDYAPSWSTGDESIIDPDVYPYASTTSGDYYMTSIYSNANWDPGRLKPGARPLILQLNGVGTFQVEAPGQSATAAISNKKWKTPVYRRDPNTDQLKVIRFDDDLSYAWTPYSFYGEMGRFVVGELKSYKLMGGTFNGETFSSVARTPVTTTVRNSGMCSAPQNGGYKYVIYYVSFMDPDLLDLGSNKVTLESVGGGHMTPQVARVAGELTKIGAYAKRYFIVADSTTTSGSTTTTIVVRRTLSCNAGGRIGTYFSLGSPYDRISTFRSGMDASSEFQGIQSVQASNYILGDFQAGTEFDESGNALAIRGNIKSMQLNVGDTFTTTPLIIGQGWTSVRPKFKGDHSQFIIHDLPYVPTDPH